jgi:hypothetical protein
MYKLLSGAKSVKQYRGDENLPEAKNGMKKGCGCKHSRSKYKYQDGSKDVASKEDYMDYLNLIKDRLSKSSNGKNYYDFILNAYKKDYRHPELSNRYIVDRESTSESEEPEEEITVRKRTSEEKPQPPKRSGVHATPTTKKFYRSNKYKYGSGALTIPEGSAIVTANGGKNKQALMAYKKGNYKLLNSIIEDMPEDNPNGINQVGNQNTQALKQKYSWFNPFTKANTPKGATSRITGETTTLDTNDEQSSYNRLEEIIGEAKAKNVDINSMKSLQHYIYDNMPDDQKNEMWSKYGPTAKESSLSQKDFMALPDDKKREIFADDKAGIRTMYGFKKPTKSNTIPNTTPNLPGKTNTEDEYEEIMTEDIKPSRPTMSAAETSAIGGVLARGVAPGPRESYLNLNKYNYASQLPKTLQEISLAEQGGRETARNIVGGDAGRYLAQSGNLSSARMNANNEAVIQDTLARQDILNKNVDISNTENTTNRNLKDYYDDIKRQNINDYNALLVKGGQSFDESFDNYQKMKNENQMKAQELQLLKEANSNYTMVRDPATGLMRSAYRYKKVNKGTPQSSTQSSTQFSAPANTNNTLSGENLDLTTTDPNNPPTMFYKKGMKKAKTYKRK